MSISWKTLSKTIHIINVVRYPVFITIVFDVVCENIYCMYKVRYYHLYFLPRTNNFHFFDCQLTVWKCFRPINTRSTVPVSANNLNVHVVGTHTTDDPFHVKMISNYGLLRSRSPSGWIVQQTDTETTQFHRRSITLLVSLMFTFALKCNLLTRVFCRTDRSPVKFYLSLRTFYDWSAKNWTLKALKLVRHH